MNRFLSLVLLTTLSGATAPGNRPIAAQPHAAAGAARAGERLEFSAGMGMLSEAAIVTIETLPLPGTGQRGGLRLLATVQPGLLVSTFYSFSYRHISTVSYPDMRPRSASRQVREGDQQSFLAFSYHHEEGYVGLSEKARGADQARDRIAANTYDMVSAIFRLRTLDPAAGSSFSVYENRHLYTLTFDPPEVEEVEVPAGTFSAWHYTVRAEPAGEALTRPEIEVWIEKDESRRPLRVSATTKFGVLVLELSSYTAAARPGSQETGTSTSPPR